MIFLHFTDYFKDPNFIFQPLKFWFRWIHFYFIDFLFVLLTDWPQFGYIVFNLLFLLIFNNLSDDYNSFFNNEFVFFFVFEIPFNFFLVL